MLICIICRVHFEPALGFRALVHLEALRVPLDCRVVDPVDVKPKARVLPPGIKSNALTLHGEPYAFVDVERGIQAVDLCLAHTQIISS